MKPRLLLAVALVLVLAACGSHRPDLSFTTGLPGAVAPGDALAEALAAAWTERPPGYVPRTRHLNPDGTPKYVNRLFLESSPYLRQHAHNPVNWFPWGDEAFELARALNRPVLLSVGYSTCHWCHVMEEESFEDEEIARFLNENYVAIKVDREERPDIDAIYMTAVQFFIGSGGWPMTVWLTPARAPFDGDTYLPPRDGDRGISVGFLTSLARLKTAYDENPDRIAEVSTRMTSEIRRYLSPAAETADRPTGDDIARAVDFYRARADDEWGGLRGAQKFPGGVSIGLLLRHHRRTGDPASLALATRTLNRMAAGGIHDQVGGGFHRYATDERWHVPHFEKMLYDNALIAVSYLEAYQVTGDTALADVVRSTLRYVMRDMTAPTGGFYAASDADSRGPDGSREEGRFFTWTSEEIDAAVGAESGRIARVYFGVTTDGHLAGRSVLHTPRAIDDVAAELGEAPSALRARIGETRERLYDARRERPAPQTDQKIVTAWNGLMIAAFARAGLVLGDPSYVDAARRAAADIVSHASGDGRLTRTTGAALRQPAFLEDYAFMIRGLLDLYEASGELDWLDRALALDAELAARYEDPEDGAFFRTAVDQEALLARQKPLYDEGEPSGNAVQALNLARLHEFTTDDRYRQRLDRSLRVFGRVVRETPAAAAEALLAVDFDLDTPKEIVLVVPSRRTDAEPFLTELGHAFVPNRILSVVVDGEDLATQARLIPLLDGKYARDGLTTAYVCENRVCDLPTTDPAVFARQLRTPAGR